MNSTEKKPDLIERLSALTDVDEMQIREIRRAINAGEPSTIDEARRICESRFTTDEQKLTAHQKWSALSAQEIDAANNYKKSVAALQHCNDKDHPLIKRALQKAVDFRKEPVDLKNLFHTINGSIEKGVVEELHAMIRTAMRPDILSMSSALYAWEHFAKDEMDKEWLSQKMEEFFTMMLSIEDNKSKTMALIELYNHLPKNHPLLFKVFTAWADNHCIDVETLRHAHRNFSKRLETAKKQSETSHGDSKKTTESWIAHLEWTVTDLVERLDNKSLKAVESVKDEKELIAAFVAACGPELKRTKERVVFELKGIWNKKLDENMPFAEARDLFVSACKVLPSQSGTVEHARKAMNLGAKTKTEVEEMINLFVHNEHYGEAIRSWLTFEPEFEELLEMQKRASQYREQIPCLVDAVVKHADTFEKAKVTLDEELWWDKESALRMIDNLSQKIGNLIEGIVALGLVPNSCKESKEYVSVLNRTFEFVTREDTFGVVIKQLEDPYQRATEMVERVLVEKALSLIGDEEEPTED